MLHLNTLPAPDVLTACIRRLEVLFQHESCDNVHGVDKAWVLHRTCPAPKG